MLYVQYGSGQSAPPGWRNFDASFRLRLEKTPGVGALFGKRKLFPPGAELGDIVAGLPIADGSADGVYCSHVLEHLRRSLVGTALRNTYRMLKPGGVFRLVVPDLGWRVMRYVERRGDPIAADDFNDDLHLRERDPPRGAVGRSRAVFGRSWHQWTYDDPLMGRLLTEAGFEAIRRCRLGDSDVEAFRLVEDPGRFVDRGYDELGMEARRPA